MTSLAFPRWKIERGCLNKQRYSEQWQAMAAAHNARQRGKDYGQPYPCQYGCGGWHLGHG